ncbi:Arp2/3 complex, 34 kd subunit p34-Arc-domain-containing protein [Chytridium lagenaria]|nr:Arp2/3 complex, 34 kd subunit p34-Arc-domain-containing protein [Chytridium lagenaria]
MRADIFFFRDSNRALEETFRQRLTGLHLTHPSFIYSEPEKISPKIKLSDFDGVSYSISTPESKSVIQLSMFMKCYTELKQYGADSVLRRVYGSLLQSAPEPGYDRLPADKEDLVKQLSLLKRNALAAPFEYAFNAQMEGRTTGLMTVHYRDEEAIYISALEDRVTVIFSTVFKEETDRIFGKVFLQEFVDARRQPAIQSAPQVLYSPKEPPLELRGVPGLIESESIGYVTFVLFPTHFAPGPTREATISRIQLFRDYLHYHIKASKAYMHSRMRARVESFLKVLNRAKPEKPDDQKEKKTASGKTFKRS